MAAANTTATIFVSVSVTATATAAPLYNAGDPEQAEHTSDTGVSRGCNMFMFRRARRTLLAMHATRQWSKKENGDAENTTEPHSLRACKQGTAVSNCGLQRQPQSNQNALHVNDDARMDMMVEIFSWAHGDGHVADGPITGHHFHGGAFGVAAHCHHPCRGQHDGSVAGGEWHNRVGCERRTRRRQR